MEPSYKFRGTPNPPPTKGKWFVIILAVLFFMPSGLFGTKTAERV